MIMNMCFLGFGDGTFLSHTTLRHRTSASEIALSDLDNDGKLDLAVAYGSKTTSDGFSALLGGTGETFGSIQRFAVSNVGIHPLNVLDLNGDGKLDLILIHESSNHNYFYSFKKQFWRFIRTFHNKTTLFFK